MIRHLKTKWVLEGVNCESEISNKNKLKRIFEGATFNVLAPVYDAPSSGHINHGVSKNVLACTSVI
jgi:hypothetical protein